MGLIKNDIYNIGLLLRLNDIIHVNSMQGLHAWDLFVCLREGVNLFLNLIPNIWDRHAVEDNGEAVIMSC